MTKETASSREVLGTVLREQQRRVVAALAAEEKIDATPILEEDEALSHEEYVTLVYELHHVHLPKLQADSVIKFDRHEGIIRRGTDFDEARSLPECSEAR